ncbi:putative protein with WD40 repeat protein [Magnetofaba australis IT-1]|uniref:Peptidase C14 caspase domain-containing protein n=1 Tax=Magnetofaba australis IT-1 TaxID=1434232 RepID=A0A1Y2K5H2_9PROT|nr:putative protein with WD40 repeat protein [Magnetofaba australis IT-1]
MLGYPDGWVAMLNLGWKKNTPMAFQLDKTGVAALGANDAGDRLATLGHDGRLTLWRLGFAGCDQTELLTKWCKNLQLQEREAVAHLDGVARPADVRRLLVAPDGAWVAWLGADGAWQRWFVASGQRESVAQVGRVGDLDAAGRTLLTERGVWDLAQTPPEPLRAWSDPDASAVALSPAGDVAFLAISATEGARIELRDVASGTLLETVRPRSWPIVTTTSMHAGQMMLVGKRQTGQWDLRAPAFEAQAAVNPPQAIHLQARESGMDMAMRWEAGAWFGPLSEQAAQTQKPVMGVWSASALSQDGRVALGDWRGQVTIRSVQGDAPARTLRVEPGAAVRDLLFLPDHPTVDLVAALGDGRVVAWGKSDSEPLWSRSQTWYNPQHVKLATDARGARLALGPVRDAKGAFWNPYIPVIRLLDPATGAVERDMQPAWGLGDATHLALSPDGALLAAGVKSGELTLFDVASGVAQAHFSAHDVAIQSLGFIDDGARLFTAGADGAVKLWSVRSPAPMATPFPNFLQQQFLRAFGLFRWTHHVATLIGAGEKDHIIATDDGYYSVSPGALRALALTQGGKAFDFESFDLYMNRPDVVLERLGYASERRLAVLRAAHVKRLKREGVMALTPHQALKRPKLRLTRDLSAVSEAEHVTLSLEAQSGDAPLKRLRVWVNSVPEASVDGREMSADAWQGDITVGLAPGENRIQVAAEDARGVLSARRTIVVNSSLSAPQPDLYIMAVGVSRYKRPGLNLTYAAKDARDLTMLFQSLEGKLYQRVHVALVDNDKVERQSVRRTAAQFFAPARASDQAILFFAGHGVLDDELDYWFGAHSLDPDNPAEAGIAYAEIPALLAQTRARNRLILIDSCHAGEVDPELDVLPDPDVLEAEEEEAEELAGRGLKRHLKRFAARSAGRVGRVGLGASFHAMQRLFSNLEADAGAVVLAAAGGVEYALESAQWSNGVFTYALREGLESGRADADDDGQIRVSELRDWLARRVRELTYNQQHPTERSANPDLDFPVALSTAQGRGK